MAEALEPAISNASNLTLMDQDELFASIEILKPAEQILVIVLYSLTALVALLGNACAIAVLMTGKRGSIRLFLVNLAISDVTMALFSIPFTYTDFILGRWIFLPEFCPVVQFMQHLSVSVSVYTLTVVGVDRYYAIIYPLNGRFTKSQSKKVVFLIWALSAGISSPLLVKGKAERFEIGGQEFYDCTEVWDEFEGKAYTMTVFLVTFVIPMFVLSYTYGSIGYKMWSRKMPGNADLSRDRQQMAAKMKVVKMMAIVVALFVLCWLPIQIFSLLVNLTPESFFPLNDDALSNFAMLFLCCHWLAMANSFVNPIIYCFMSDNFRTDLHQLVTCERRGRVRLDPRTSTFMTGSSSQKASNVALRPLKPQEESLLRRSARERAWCHTQLDSKLSSKE